MKSYSATGRCGAAVAVRRRTVVAIRVAAATAFALMLAVAGAGPSRAQDASKDGSSWDRVDSVLVLPPVYRPDAESASADACAEDCSASSNQGLGEFPRAVAGTADNPANASAGTADNPADNPSDESATVDASTPDGSGSQAERSGSQNQQADQQGAAGGDPQGADSLDSSLGSAQDYEEQQAAAQELGNSGIVQAPFAIIGAPFGPYYAPRSAASAARAFAPARSLPASPAWMPQPMARVAPLPSIVPHGVPGAVGGFPGGFYGSFRGSFPHMSGFHGGFGHR